MKFKSCSTALLCTLFLGLGSLLQANEAFEAQLKKLMEDQYAVRMEAKKSLIEMCCRKSELIDTLIMLTLDPKAHPEQVFISKEIIRDVFEETIFIEPGTLGCGLSRELVVVRLDDDAPAKKAGVQLGSRLLSVAGDSVYGMQSSEIYGMIQTTRPGTKLEMEFLNPDGEKVIRHPVVMPCSPIHPGNKAEKHQQQAYSKWMEGKLRKYKAN